MARMIKTLACCLGLLAGILFTIPALAEEVEFTDFKARITIEKWDVDRTDEDDWDWLHNSTTNNVVLENFMDEYRTSRNDYFFITLEVIRINDPNDTNPIVGASVQKPNNEVFPLVFDELGDLLYVSEFHTNASGLIDDCPAGDYTINVTFDDGSSETQVITLPNYESQILSEPSMDLETNDGLPERLETDWTSTRVDRYGFRIYTAQSLVTWDLVNTIFDAGGVTQGALVVDNLSYQDGVVYFLTGFISDTTGYVGFEYRSTRIESFETSDDSDDETTGCTLAGGSGMDLGLLVLVLGAVALLRGKRSRLSRG